MKRIGIAPAAAALLMFFPRSRNHIICVMNNNNNNQHRMINSPMAMAMAMVMASSASSSSSGASASPATTATTSPTSASAAINVRAMSMSNGKDLQKRCVVSRNGILLPWGHIHQKYKQVDTSDTASSSSSSSDDHGDDDACQGNEYINNNNNNNDNNNNEPMDSSTLLQHLPRGAYTTCRTVRGGTHIYQFDYHVRRLARSAESILENINIAGDGDGDNNGMDHTDTASTTSSDNNNNNHGDKNENDRRESESASSLSKSSNSNHPQQQQQQQQQHCRTPSKVEIQDLKITDKVWERKMALNCIRATLEQFRLQYKIPNDGGAVCVVDDNDNGYGGSGTLPDLDYRITLLATWEKAKEGTATTTTTTNDSKQQQSSFQSVLYCHVGILPQSEPASMGNNSNSNNVQSSSSSQRKHNHIKVLIHGHGRENARAKDSKWVIDRKKLTTPDWNTGDTATTAPSSSSASSSSNESYEEIILLNDNDELLEGTQTNFYVVSEKKNQSQSQSQSIIITATEDILHGSVRDSVLRVCQTHKVKVEHRPPTLDDLQHATGVFITSTSRLVMPVHEVVLGDLQALSSSIEHDTAGEEGGDKDGTTATEISTSSLPTSYCYPNCGMTENIRQWVLEDVATHSTSVYHPE